jgi:hypothetical protein
MSSRATGIEAGAPTRIDMRQRIAQGAIEWRVRETTSMIEERLARRAGRAPTGTNR